MSTEIKEEIKELDQDMLKNLISEVVKNPEMFQTEAKYLLKLELEWRASGCGYVYLFGQDIEKLAGDADIVVLEREESYDCTMRETIVVVPKSVPVILLEHTWDDTPQTQDKLTIHVFNGEGWINYTMRVPKTFRLSDILP